MSIHMLKKGAKLPTCSGKHLTVTNFVGEGGQGEVYRVKYGGNPDYALKWYFHHSATGEQLEMLKVLTSIGAPNERFLWPLDIVQDATQADRFGYVMPFRPARFRAATGLLSRKVEPTFGSLLTACFQLADSFFQLHSKGLAYRDISINNLFIDPDTGDILICDNDNAGYENTSYAGVLGTPKYMAPEVVRGEKLPDRYTDLFSLSLLLFYLLYIAHPLDGKREAAIRAFDEAAMRKIYGLDPLYIFHPTDNSNAPEPDFHGNAIAFHKVYPQVLKRTFERAFVEGLNDPRARVEESVWRGLFVALNGHLIHCDACGGGNFYDQSLLRDGQTSTCWSCGTGLQLPPRMRLSGGEVVMLDNHLKLYRHHTGGILYDFSAPTAEISAHPTLGIKGLKNLSEDTWYVTRPGGSTVAIPPGRSFALGGGSGSSSAS